MNNLERILRKAIISLTGKAVMLCGVAFATTTCVTKYGPGPDPVPDYWSDHAPEQINSSSKVEWKSQSAFGSARRSRSSELARKEKGRLAGSQADRDVPASPAEEYEQLN